MPLRAPLPHCDSSKREGRLAHDESGVEMESSDSFPGVATVRTKSRGDAPISTIKVGDSVWDGTDYTEVFMQCIRAHGHNRQELILLPTPYTTALWNGRLAATKRHTNFQLLITTLRSGRVR